MGRRIKIVAILAAITATCASCQKNFKFAEQECNFNNRLHIYYNQENGQSVNVMDDYASCVEAYIFDQNDLLIAIERLEISELSSAVKSFKEKSFVFETSLAPGKYSVIALANRTDELTKFVTPPTVGVTTKNEMEIHSAEQRENDSDSLYYGYRAFEITENRISDVRLDMVYAHCDIRFVIRWKKNNPGTGDYRVAFLKDLPSYYKLVPGFFFKTDEASHVEYQPSEHDFITNETVHYYPAVEKTDTPGQDVKELIIITTEMEDEALTGQIIMNRLRNDSRIRLSVWSSDGISEIMKPVDLQNFFQQSGIDLDYNRKQEFTLLFEVEYDKVTVSIPGGEGWE